MNAPHRSNMRAYALFIAISCLLLLLAISGLAAATDPPPWQQVVPHDPAQDTTVMASGRESTMTHEKREYTREDGTVVKEERLVDVIKEDGKLVSTNTHLWSTEEKGDDKVKIRRNEKTDADGNKTVWEKKEITKRGPEGLRTDYYLEEKGKIYYTGYYLRRDRAPEKKAETEKAEIKPDKDGNTAEKTVYSQMQDGSVTVDRYLWVAAKGDWGPSLGTTLITPPPPDVIGPTTCTTGYAIGGSVEDKPEVIIATATVIAESTDGKRVEVPLDEDGRWSIPPGMLTTGLWKIFSTMTDGRQGDYSLMAVLSGIGQGSEAAIEDLPSMCFTGTSLRLRGTALSSKTGSAGPNVVMVTDEGSYLADPISYSDTEVLFRLTDDVPRGVTSVFVDSGDSVSKPQVSQMVSFDIIVPASIQVGRDFLVTIQITGLSGELLKESFTALITISGPASFVGTDSKEILVELNGGMALIMARANSSGQFLVNGKLVNLPKY